MSDDDAPTNPTLEVKDGGHPGRASKSLLASFLDTKGNNFLGSGISFSDWVRTADYLRYERCYITQTREEKRRRLMYLVRLAGELERILDHHLFATSWAEAVIEGVLEGDWKQVAMWCAMLTFEDEDPHVREVAAPIFAKFVEIGREAHATRPVVFCPVCRKQPTKLRTWADGRHLCPNCDVVFDDSGNAVPKARAHLRPVLEES